MISSPNRWLTRMGSNVTSCRRRSAPTTSHRATDARQLPRRCLVPRTLRNRNVVVGPGLRRDDGVESAAHAINTFMAKNAATHDKCQCLYRRHPGEGRDPRRASTHTMFGVQSSRDTASEYFHKNRFRTVVVGLGLRRDDGEERAVYAISIAMPTRASAGAGCGRHPL